MKITLDIQESRFNTFLAFIKTLDYVSVKKESAIPQWQQEEVNRRLQLIEKGEMKTRSWNEAKADIFKK
ncbi:MAG: addiction module protein [Flavobacteriaceae bacterium]|nr:addiction module protein [Flavobacteriaceae bacterium]